MKEIELLPSDTVPEGAVFIGVVKSVVETVVKNRYLVPDDQSEPSEPPVPTNDFITVSNGQFKLNGEIIKFAGTNAYYLPTYESHDPSFCDRTWNLFSESGINLVRSWGFYDGQPKFDGDPTFHTFEDGKSIYNEEGLKCLDRTVAKASERSIHLILSLTNYHPELGGYREYCKAVGVPETFSDFMGSDLTRELFKDYINTILTRVNTVTGKQYKDEPFILGWEICNEARNPENDPTAIRDWYQDIAQFIKSIDSNHLVATGEDGFEHSSQGSYGTDGKIRNDNYTVNAYSNTYVLRAPEGTSYLLNTAIPEIDFGGIHWYPSDFGFGYSVTPELLSAQKAWIEDHVIITNNFGKPIILGEYGFHINWLPNTEVYNHLWGISENHLNGTLLWQLVADGYKLNEYGGNLSPTRGNYTEFLTHIKNMTQ